MLVAVAVAPVLGAPSAPTGGRKGRGTDRGSLEGSVPLSVRAKNETGRYFVVMKAPSVAERVDAARQQGTAARPTGSLVRAVEASQQGALAAATASGAKVTYRYSRVANAFAATMTGATAQVLAQRSDVKAVQRVNVVRQNLSSSVPSIGTKKVWKKYKAKGQGITVAVIDTGIDYLHKALGGSGSKAAYQSNDPSIIEPGTFPTKKVIGGYDFVGTNYDVIDEDPANDTPNPDPDPLDDGVVGDHGTHVAGTCCGTGVKGKIGKGVAPKAKLLAYKVWHSGSSTADVLVAAFERAVDPNEDGNFDDKADVINFSGGVDFGSAGSLEGQAAENVANLGVVFVAAAGNAGNSGTGGTAYVGGTPGSSEKVITVAASIDQFLAQTTEVLQPSGIEFVEDGLTVYQMWSGDPGGDFKGQLFDVRELNPPADPSGAPSAADQQLCAPVVGTPLAGKIALIYKASTGDGDCAGVLKSYNAQLAGAKGVIFRSGFFGVPFGLATDPADPVVTIPAWMVGTADGEVLGEAVSPDAPTAFYTRNTQVKIGIKAKVIPGYKDRMTDFTSQGPARISNILKPDVTAPGYEITSANAGTGKGKLTISGTSMATPHVAGAAALLLQVHKGWGVEEVKAALMNQAKEDLVQIDGTGPVPATIQGAGRIRVDQSARAKSLAYPGSLSFGLQPVSEETTLPTQTITVENESPRKHNYSVASTLHQNSFAEEVATLEFSLDNVNWASTAAFSLTKKSSRELFVRMTVHPGQLADVEEFLGWITQYADIDGAVKIKQTLNGSDTLRVVWQVVPMAASDDTVGQTSVDLGGAPVHLDITSQPAAGTSFADLYVLGGTSAATTHTEEDITHFGARSFAGTTLDGTPEGVPTGVDPAFGVSWIDFLTDSHAPDEPLEFGIRTDAIHNAAQTAEVTVFIDAGNDGNYADDELNADFLAVKPQNDVRTCLYDLSVADPFAACAESYFADYSQYNSNLFGIVIDAGALGLTNGDSEIGYGVEVCTGGYSGDIPSLVCDTAGAQGNGWSAELDVTDPGIEPFTWFCGGFFGGPACSAGIDINGNNQSLDLMVLFPNNRPEEDVAVVETT